MVSEMLAEHMQKVSKITLKRVPSQARELLGTVITNPMERTQVDKGQSEPTTNQEGIAQEIKYV